MCADSGLWCKSNGDCPGTDTCGPATSRMMTVKRALRRAITEYSDKVNFGFMNTYQGKGVNATDSDASIAIFPYVKLQSYPSSDNVTETKLLTRGELEKSGCFSLTSGPSSSCMVDYGGNGAVNNSNAALNQVTYSLVGTADSRWAIPRGDGSGKSNHLDTSWSSCPSTAILPACEFSGQGTGIYEGSYYSFTYKQGTPMASGQYTMAQPKYYTSYKGKFYHDPGDGNYYNAIDAERTEIVNDGVYNRPAYTLVAPATSPYTMTGTGSATSVAIDTTKEASIPVPWSGATNAGSCGGQGTGAIWNSNVVPFLNSTVSQTGTGTSTSTAAFTFGGQSITPAQKTLMTTARLEKASFGGVDATGSVAPIACALNDAGNYMGIVQSNDVAANGNKTPCWSNNIVLVVDGWANGPGDMGANIDCASTACAYNSATNPTLAGCNCTAITRAKTLAASGVQTHVVVNAPASWKPADPNATPTAYNYLYAFMWNLALAGSPNFDGTPSFGTTEEEVYKAVSDKIAAAAYHFPYTTTAPVAGTTTQDPNTLIVSNSNFLYDTSVSYPSWKGTLRAFDVTSSVDLKWDAVTVAASGYPADWTKRRIFFSDTSGNVVQVQISGAGNITNKSTLHSVGLGATDAEAESIMQWLLGKPGLGNPTPVMGSISSSTPIAVGQGAVNGLNGSSTYSQNTWKRPQLVYVGADDGMLHAFFGHAGSMLLGGASYQGGEEAFAFIPNDMLPVITKLYAQGGQKLPVDKGTHIFGLAASPKVKDMCIGSGCDQSTGGNWHTVLVMPEGPGGNKPFALDITNVVDETNGLLHQGSNSLTLLWSAAPVSSGSTNGVKLSPSSDGDKWVKSLGETTSVPAFYFAGYVSGWADNRVIFASGYQTKTGAGYDHNQGLVILNADATNGGVKDTRLVYGKGTTGCSQKQAVMADVSLARDYSSLSTSQNLMAAYVGDTWGNTFQYVPSASDSSKILTSLYSLGCGLPLYFAPAVVQLDRAPKADTSSKHFIYLAQVTNSDLDPDTMMVTSNYPASQLVVTKLDGNVSPPIIVTSYNPLSGSGQIVLTTDPAASASNRICIQTGTSGSLNPFTDNTKKMTQSCADAGAEPLPSGARPVGTPTAVLRADGLGFQVITGWYDPTAVSNDCTSGKQFNYGKSYITVHEFGADGTWYQIAGVPIDNTVLTGIAFVGTGLFIDGINASSAPKSINIGETFSTTQQILNNSGRERYLRTSWSERQDL
jgi:hypothetical protein